MIVTINNENGTTTYDVSKVNAENLRTHATVLINKVGTIEVILEALNFTSSTHRANLEALLKDCPLMWRMKMIMCQLESQPQQQQPLKFQQLIFLTSSLASILTIQEGLQH